MNRSHLILCGLCLCLSLFAETAPFKAGTWLLMSGGCSNPTYVPTTDEKEFWDAVKSGQSLDEYVFTDSTHGEYRQKMSFAYVSCVGTTPMDIAYLSDGVALASFGKTEWKVDSSKPSHSLQCTDQGPHKEKWHYRWDKEALIFYTPQDSACGEFQIVFVPAVIAKPRRG